MGAESQSWQHSSSLSSLQLPGPSGEGGSCEPGIGSGLDGRPWQDGSVPPHWAHWKTGDPRTSSSQSLVSPATDSDPRRKLLLVYIHGFMGNDSSFRSFPAHVHNLLREALSESHVIHTKIYPRYKTYKSINIAAENFSKWLEPHESPTTDVVLIGHSMGGLLAADIVLLPNLTSTSYPFRHRILGTISLDAPLLGLHPGIIVSGIASLFRPAAAPPEGSKSEDTEPTTSPWALSPEPSIYSGASPTSESTSPSIISFPPPTESSQDPHFNPPFFNDVLFKDRGWLRNIAHFANKHKSENLVGAATSHIMSHLEFGSCLADYPRMHSRYNKLRGLEDVDDLSVRGETPRKIVQVRFVNYYTASTGRTKEPKAQPAVEPSSSSLRPEDAGQPSGRSSNDLGSRPSTPRISIEDHSDSGRPVVLQQIEPIPEPDELPPPYTEDGEVPAFAQADPAASVDILAQDAQVSESEPADTPAHEVLPTGLEPVESTASVPFSAIESLSSEPDFQLPAVPDLPPPPEPVDLEKYSDKEARKQAEKEAKRVQKAYETAVKNREKAVKERQRLVEKWRRRTVKDAERRDKDAQKDAARREREEKKRALREEQELQRELDELRLRDQRYQADASGEGKGKGKAKVKKERKFCMLPGKVNGQRDSAWLRVYMEGVDEVGAHCGLFVPGPHYEPLIGDVGSRIVNWVHDDATKRAILGMDT